jgi:transposase-like protein
MSGTMERRRFPRELKMRVLQELDTGKTPAEVCREHGVHPSTLSRWKSEYRKDPEEAFAGNGNTWKLEAKVRELESLVGRLCLENDFLKKATERLQLRLQEERRGGQR